MKSILSFLDRLFKKQKDKPEASVKCHLTPEEAGCMWLKENMRPSKLQGEIVIACPNEWAKMCVGRVQGELTNGILIIHDFVVDTELVVFSPWVKFSIEELKNLCALNPYERYNRVAKNSSVEMCKPKLGVDNTTFEDYMACVLKHCPEIFNNQ